MEIYGAENGVGRVEAIFVPFLAYGYIKSSQKGRALQRSPIQSNRWQEIISCASCNMSFQ